MFSDDSDPYYNLLKGIRAILKYVEPDTCHREGLQNTPSRSAQAWDEWTSGYDQQLEDVLKCFEDGATGYDEMVVVKNVPFYSHCEHHLAAIFGNVAIGYIPNKRIVGLSKLPRLVDIFAKRLQVQERMTVQIADAINEHLQPIGVGVIIRARHLCMESRGINRPGTETVTSALRGKMKEEDKVRSEFLRLVSA
jgi:GTP cyclohydrolase I